VSRTSIKVLGGSLAVGLGASALAALGAPAYAATGTTDTSTIRATTVTNTGSPPSWFDSGLASPENPGPHRTASLTAVAVGPDVEFTLNLSKGPTSPAAPVTEKYNLDAFVRLDGAANSGGTRFAGPGSDVDAASNTVLFPGGVVIKGKFLNAGLGDHTLTLSRLMLDIDGIAGGGLGGEPSLFDTFYTAGTTREEILDNPVDWPLSTTVTVASAPVADKTKPVAKVSKPKKKAAKKGKSWKTIKGTLTDDRGAKDARVKLVAKTKTGWTFFNGTKYKAVKGKKKALKKAKTLVAVPNAKGAWKVKVGTKAPKGKLTVQYWGTDLAGNVSKKKKLTQKITK
jgi:hypothetical protein